MPEKSEPIEVAVSVSEMARIVGLSRSRFHQLLKQGVFPQPRKCDRTSRPYYDQLGQSSCIEVRRTRLGLNGQTVMFYARRLGGLDIPMPTTTSKRSDAQNSSLCGKRKMITSNQRPKPQYVAIIEGLRQLGLLDLTEQNVVAAMSDVFPQGSQDQPYETVLLALFRHLVRRNSGDNVGRQQDISNQ